MRNLKLLFILLGILSSICVLVWDAGKHKLKDSGVEYVHSIVYSNTILKSKIGDITAIKIARNEGKSIGDKYYLRIYENVRVRTGEAMAVTVVVHEKEIWSLWSLILMQNGKSEQIVDYGQFR